MQILTQDAVPCRGCCSVCPDNFMSWLVPSLPLSCLCPAVARAGDVFMYIPMLVPLLPYCALCSTNTVLGFWQGEDNPAKN